MNAREGSKEEERDGPKGSAVAFILNRLRIHISSIIRPSTNEEYEREERVLKWVTRVIEDDDDDDCSHRC